MEDDDTISMISMASTATSRETKKRHAKEYIKKLKMEKQKYLLLNVQYQSQIEELKKKIKQLENNNKEEGKVEKEEEKEEEEIKKEKKEEEKEEEKKEKEEKYKKMEEEYKRMQLQIKDMKNINDTLRCQLIDINIENQKEKKREQERNLAEKKAKANNIKVDTEKLIYIYKTSKNIKENYDIMKNDTKRMLNRFIENETKGALSDLNKFVEEFIARERAETEFEAKEFCGYFMKQGAKRKSWRKRWFIFRSDLTFEYFKSSQPGQKPLNSVSCKNKFDVHVDASMHKSFCFRIISDKRIFFLVASNAEECHRTIQRLRLWQEVNSKRLKTRSESLSSTSTT